MKISSNEQIPQHIAIIMDGNGRWARERNLPRARGHLEGVKRVEEIIEAAYRMGLKVLTLYTFSTENWRRPKTEVTMLMNTLVSVLGQKLKKIKKNNLRFRMIGCREDIPPKVLRSMDSAMKETAANTGMVLNLAFNYGSRKEITDAVKDIAARVKNDQMDPEDIDEAAISASLYTGGLPDPDLLIRTSGEIRISNFLLWQLSYAELYFTEKYWPDFDVKELEKAIGEYQRRERRYGTLKVT